LRGWALDLARRWNGGTYSLFVVHGNIFDLFPVRDNSELSYAPLKTFLVRRLFPERACLLFYDISDGLTFGSNDTLGSSGAGPALEPMSSISYEAAIGAAIVAFNDLWAVHSLPSIWPTPNFLKALLQWPLLRFDPNDFDASPVLANLKVMEGRGAEAVACMERALRLNPHPPGPYYWDLGQAHYAAGDYKAAVKALQVQLSYCEIRAPISGRISCPHTKGTNNCRTISPMVRQAEPDRRWLESTRLTTIGVTKIPMMLEAEALQTAAGTFPFAMAVKAIED